MGDKLPQSTPVLVRRLKRVAANCLKASRAATTDADRISWNARANTCWQCVARLEELSLRATGEGRDEPFESRSLDGDGPVSRSIPADSATELQSVAAGSEPADSHQPEGAPVAVSLLEQVDDSALWKVLNEADDCKSKWSVDAWRQWFVQLVDAASELSLRLEDPDFLARLRGEDASPDAQLLPVYFGLVATLAEVLGPDTYKVEARHLPAWARARLSEVVKR